MTVKVVILTLDNLPMLREQVALLREDPLIDGIVVVDNGSRDGTRTWLEGERGLTAVYRHDRAPGPGRNAGLEAAGAFDHVLLLDGGIRPLRNGTRRMLDYLERRRDVDVIGVELSGYDTDPERAWREWPEAITDQETFPNRALSHTAYCLARARAFEGIRFCDQGPFAEAGWGVDDNEMAYHWTEAGILLHVTPNARPYRRAAGSFQRLFEETGIWPNQYGSVYEKRLVWCQQEWPQHHPGVQWGEPWLTVVVKVGADARVGIQTLKRAHDQLRLRLFPDGHYNPYSLVAWCARPSGFLDWAEPRRLRQHHGDTVLLGRQIVRRSAHVEAHWTGDFRLWHGEDAAAAIRPRAFLWGVVEDELGLDTLLARYQAAHPHRDRPPAHRAPL